MRLLGAKEFLKTVKPGTLCVEFWLSSEEECLNLIEDYKKGANIFEKYYGEFYIFGDNSGSLAFLFGEEDAEIEEIDGFKYDCLWYYDKNIVGDASPWTTLQLVYDNEDEWPEVIHPIDCEESLNKDLHKDDIKRIAKNFVEEHTFRDETSEAAWALKSLENDDSIIVNYKG